MDKNCYNALKKMIEHTHTESLFELRVGLKGKITIYNLATMRVMPIKDCIILWLRNKCDFTILSKDELNALLSNRK